MTGVEHKNLSQLGLYQTSDLFESSSRTVSICITMHACLFLCYTPTPFVCFVKSEFYLTNRVPLLFYNVTICTHVNISCVTNILFDLNFLNSFVTLHVT
jgi:hypothetical protein